MGGGAGVGRGKWEEGQVCVWGTQSTSLCTLHTSLHLKSLCCRVEDTDDLTPILMKHTSDLSQMYGKAHAHTFPSYLRSTGEHFMAEMIESQDSDHRTFVAEVSM